MTYFLHSTVRSLPIEGKGFVSRHGECLVPSAFCVFRDVLRVDTTQLKSISNVSTMFLLEFPGSRLRGRTEFSPETLNSHSRVE